MAIAGVLEVQMMADMARISKDMNDAKRIVGDAAGGMSNSLLAIKTSIEASLSPLQQLTLKVGSLESQMGKAKDAALSMGKALLLGAAAGMGIDAIKDKIIGVINSMAALKTLSEKTGSSVENLSKLGFIAKQSGSDIDSVAAAMNKLSKGMAGADNETKGAGLALSYLGVSAKDAAGNLKDPAVMFTEIAKKLGEYQDGAGKAAVSQALFGKAGADMLPTLKLLGEQGDLVAKVTDAQATAARQYTRDIAKLDVQKGMLFKTVAIALLPTMTDFVGVLLDASKQTNIVNSAAKSLANDNSITNWADAGAMGLARLIDVIKVLPALFTALKSSFSAVLADIEFVGKSAMMLNPVNMAKKIGQGENPVGDLKLFLAQRNKTLADANAAYSTMWTSEANSTEQAMAKRISARQKDRSAMEAQDAALKAAEAAKPKLNYNTAGEDKAAKDAKESIDQQAKAYVDLTAKINEKIASNILEASTGKTLTEAQAKQLEIDKLVITGKIKAADASSELTKKLLLELDASEKAKTLALEIVKANLAQAEAHGKYVQSLAAGVTKLDDQVRAQREATAEIGLSKDAIGELRAAEEERKAAIEESFAVRQFEKNLNEAEYNLALANVKALRELAAAKRAFGTRETAYAAEQEQVKEQLRLINSVDTTAQAVWTNVFDGGSNAFKKLGQTLKTAVLDMLYQMTIKKWIISVTGSVTGAGASAMEQASGGGGGIGGLLSSASSIGSLASGAGILGAGGLGLQAGFGALINGGFAGVSAAVSGGLAAIGTGAGAGIAAGLGTIAGALGPIALGAAVIYSLLNKKGIASSSTGSMERSYDADGTITSSKSPFSAGNGAGVVDSLYTAFSVMQKALGATGGSNFGYGGYSGNDNKNPMMRVSGGSFNSGEIAATDDNMKLAANRAVLGALMTSQLPRELAGIFNGVHPEAMDQKAIDNVYAYAQSLKALDVALLASPFENLKNLSYEAAQGLIAASGGLEKLIPNLASYYDNFYSAEEKRVRTVSQITDRLNAAGANMTTDQVGGMSRDDFRAKFETKGNSNELNAALLAVSGAFASIVPVAVAAAASIVTISDTMKTLQKDRASLQADVMQARGDTGGADAVRRALTVANYTAVETAAYDYNQALRQEIKTRQDATAAAISLAATNKGLADQLAVMKGTETDRSIALRDATDNTTRELLRQIYAQQDLKTATQDAALAATQAAAAQKAAAVAAMQSATTAVTNAFNQVNAAANDQKAALSATFQSLTNDINAQLSTVGASIGKLQSLSSALSSTLSNLQVSGGQNAARVDAQSTIAAMLETAKSGGGLPVNTQALTTALSTVSKPSEQLFGSFVDYARDFYKTSNNISALNDLTSKGLTSEQIVEATLKAQLVIAKASYDSQITQITAVQTQAKAQLDALNGNTTVLSTLKDALAAFSSALTAAVALSASQIVAATLLSSSQLASALGLTSTQLTTAVAATAAQTAATAGLNTTQIAAALGLSTAQLATALGLSANQLTNAVALNATQTAAAVALNATQGSTATGLSANQIAAALGLTSTQLSTALGLTSAQLTASVAANATQTTTATGLSAAQIAAAINSNALQITTGAGLSAAQLVSSLALTVTQLSAATGLSASQIASAVALNAAQTATASGLNTTQIANALGLNASQLAGALGLTASQLTAAVALNATQTANAVALNANQATTSGGINAALVSNAVGSNAIQIATAAGLNAAQLAGALGLSSAQLAAVLGLTATQLTAAVALNATQIVGSVVVLPPQIANAVSAVAVLSKADRASIVDDAVTKAKANGTNYELELYKMAQSIGYLASDVDKALGLVAGATAGYVARAGLTPLTGTTAVVAPPVVAPPVVVPAYISAVAVLSASDRASVVGAAITAAAANGTDYQMELYNLAKSIGYKAQDVDQALGLAAGATQGYISTAGLPQLAVGTNYIPRDMIAQLHEGEAVLPKAFNPAAGGGSGDSEGLKNEIKAMRSDLNAALLKIAQNTGKTAKLNDRWNVDGLPATRTTT